MLAKHIQKVANPSLIKFSHENYAFQPLRAEHREQAIKLLGEQFESQEPLSIAFYRMFPLNKTQRVQRWSDFWRIFADDFTNNGISVGCFDKHNNNQLIGISVAKDLLFVPDNFQKDYMSSQNFIMPIIRLQEKMLEAVDPNLKPLLNRKDTVMDIWGVAIKKAHMGRRLLHKMMHLNDILGSKVGFTHSFSYASNFKTGVALKKEGFVPISSIDASKFQYEGIKYFQKIDDLHRNPTLFLRPLEHD